MNKEYNVDEFTYYKCVEDLQGTDWSVGVVLNVGQWRERAIEWATSDDNYELVEDLKKMSTIDVMPFIGCVWALRFKNIEGPVNETDIIGYCACCGIAIYKDDVHAEIDGYLFCDYCGGEDGYSISDLGEEF